MTAAIGKESFLQPTNLQEAINIIKFLTTSHKQEVSKLKEINHKHTESIKKLEANRKKELEFLSKELHKYEENLTARTEAVTRLLAEKDVIIQKQLEEIEELNRKLKPENEFCIPDIVLGDSNSDSGVAMENDDSILKIEELKVDKPNRKCSRRFAESISFLRRVDFSPIKYRPCNRDGNKKKEESKKHLDVPRIDKRMLTRQYSNDRPTSEDERLNSEEAVLSDGSEPIMIRPKKMNDSMNNHFSDDGSEDTSEELFDRVMTRSSVRKSVKANPKYKKINRTKSKLLEQSKSINNIVD